MRLIEDNDPQPAGVDGRLLLTLPRGEIDDKEGDTAFRAVVAEELPITVDCDAAMPGVDFPVAVPPGRLGHFDLVFVEGSWWVASWWVRT